MKIKLVNVESGISAIGFRRIAAIAKASKHDVEVLFVPTDNKYKTLSYMFPDNNAVLGTKDIYMIANYLVDADAVMFSSMTISAKYVERIISVIKSYDIPCKIIWGGAHPTLYPEEALEYADEICVGEGEKYMEAFVGVKHETRHSFQGFECKVYNFKKKQFKALTEKDYAVFNGTLFRTIWTIGCPNSCAYCANDALIKLDPNYRKLRYPSVNWIIEEVELALKQYPFITTVAFDDDNFISLPLSVISQFCYEWEHKIKLPFVIYGMHPNTVNKLKVEILAEAGMNRVRMGIQSFSPDTLKRFNRNTKIDKIIISANILIDAGKEWNMVPPAFDIITDCQENEYDQTWNLAQLYNLHRPFTLTIFSLRAMPGTKLYNDGFISPNTPYTQTQKNRYNTNLYLLAMFKTNVVLSKRWYHVIKFLYHIHRGIGHIIRGDFSRISGKWGYWIWKLKNALAK